MPKRSVLPCAISIVLSSSQAHAAARTRPLFEPTDMELQEPGSLQVDIQAGGIRGADVARAALPDFEIDLGLGRNAELDIDGQYAIEGPGAHGFRLDRPGPDNLWLASKLGLLDERSSSGGKALAFGVQFGPKFPVAADNKGVGCEGLMLVAGTVGDVQLVLNAGALLDPGTGVSSGRPAGLEGGLDLSVVVSKRHAISVLGEVGGVRFLSRDAHQLHATAGLSWSASKSLDLSLIGLKGLLSGGDRHGILVGMAQRFDLY